MRNLMLTDKDYILKSSRAFVSFVRSFKEHHLSSMLKFKNLDIFATAKSFFLFKLPVIKDFKDLTLNQPLASEEELKKFESADFSNKNQKVMIKKKIEEAIEKRQGILEKRAHRKEQLEKEQDKKKIRSKAERNRAKTRETVKQFNEFSKEEKLKKKLKTGKLSKQDYEEEVAKIDKKYEY